MDFEQTWVTKMVYYHST